MPQEELQAALQRLSGTTLDTQGAANAWAGTTGRDLLGALNAKAGTTGLGLLAAVRTITSGAETLAGFEGGGGTPTTYTIFGDVSDGYINAGGANNASGDGVDTTGDIYTGQAPGGYYEGFLAFDTSTVVGTITAVTLSVYGMNDSSVTDFTLEARLHDWGATLTTADWVPGNQLGTKTLLASMNTSGWSAAGYNTLTSDAAFLTNINQSGFTRVLMCSSRHRLGNTPSGSEFVGYRSANQAGTTNDPKLVIETT